MIPSIGKPKISYKDHTTVNFESLDFYLGLSKKIIAKIGPTFFSSLSKDMLNNEDAIAFVANAIMMGDWRWREKNTENPEKNKNLYSYRNQCGIWAIKTYVTKKYQRNSKRKNKEYSLNYINDHDLSMENIISDTEQKDPMDILILEESMKEKRKLVKELFNSDLWNTNQKEQIKMYYFDGLTLEQIGHSFGVTREAIRQNIKNALEKVRSIT
jgi:RNA polymerase sigma factor (sigma-70 family)